MAPTAQAAILPTVIHSFTMWMPASCAAPALPLVPCMKSRRGLPALQPWRRPIASSPIRENPARQRRARLSALQDEHGIWDCTRCNFCVEVCPKDVKPMEAIIRLRRASLEYGLTETGGARHILGFTDLVEQQGRLNEAIMPLKVVGIRAAWLACASCLWASRCCSKGKSPTHSDTRSLASAISRPLSGECDVPCRRPDVHGLDLSIS